MITMYGFGKVTPQVVGITRDLRVLWALEECELPHQVNGLDDVAGELHSADYLAINPFGKVPAIDHDGVIRGCSKLCVSLVIIGRYDRPDVLGNVSPFATASDSNFAQGESSVLRP
ncbi:glutathione S-transferase [Halomonas sp. FME16]|uniref:Glutathione S-transferase n=1 Tax=Halomonas citrativorans TaxID=2742612 RepID=A0ABR9FFB6_9GAMM|nr:glutathione S-transferase [Halomonas citrativorans]